MSGTEVPFYAQAAILDRYIHSSDPASDPAALEVILEALRSKQDLRSYFFRRGPSAAWASVLWENDFLRIAPEPEKHKDGYALPRWEAQDFLISVANQAPQVVVKHAQAIQGHGFYIARAIEALRSIPIEAAESLVTRILEWLNDPIIAPAISSEAYELMVEFAKGKSAAAFTLFRVLTSPLSPAEGENKRTYFRGDIRSLLMQRRFEYDDIETCLQPLQELDTKQLCCILEEQLLATLKLEAEARNSPDYEYVSWWRQAIEDTGQDLHDDYSDILLKGLRDSLEAWVQQDASTVGTIIQKYLNDRHEILRRLALHLLQRFPDRYSAYVTKELLNITNLDDAGIHHEFFMLLQKGSSCLSSEQQRELINSILQGPPQEKAERMADWAQKEFGEERNEYIRGYSKVWIRDRLWMLKENLPEDTAEVLSQLVSELGEPEHAAFTSWTTGAYTVSDISPLTEEQIAGMLPDELISYLENWQPDPNRQFGPERVSYSGLASIVAHVILNNLQKYDEHHVTGIALLRPEFSNALLNQSSDTEVESYIVWNRRLHLCESILAIDKIRTDTNRGYDSDWTSVRQSIVRFLESGLENEKTKIPSDDLARVRNLLLTLLFDPDPALESDRPQEGWVGHRDPATVALNHVRPSALIALIQYANYKAYRDLELATEDSPQGPGYSRLENTVREALTLRLNRDEEPSWAVHSVYGRYLCLLYWLDQEWLLSHIDDIFPQGDDEESSWLYVAAWDSYVIFNRSLYKSLFELLRPKYERAIENISRGYVSQTHLEPVKGLAIHLFFDYLQSHYNIRSSEGQESLIAMFFNKALPDARGQAAWLLWRTCHDRPENLEVYWPKARALWQWRLEVASSVNHPTDFHKEMEWYSRLLLVAPKSETMASLWPLLEGFLPYISQSEHRDILWESLEEYLSAEVERDPARVIRYYHLMHNQLKILYWYHHKEARKIIETAATHRESRQEALSLIDLIARLGFHGYRDIYERYAR